LTGITHNEDPLKKFLQRNEVKQYDKINASNSRRISLISQNQKGTTLISPKNVASSLNNIFYINFRFSKRMDEKSFHRVKRRLSLKKEIDLKPIIMNIDSKKNSENGNIIKKIK
jgi:hypothetical protein